MTLLIALFACKEPLPPGPVFPYTYTEQPDLEAYEEVRWETETWETTNPQMLGLYLQKAFYHRPSAPIEELEHFRTMKASIPPVGDGIELAFVGDIMHIDQNNWAEYATPAAPLLAGADLRIGNLETPVSVDHSTFPRALGTYAFNAPPEMLDGLPVDVLQLTNNHSLDAEDLGLENTVAEVVSRGIIPVGVDTQATVEVEGLQVAFLAYTWGINDRRSTDQHELHIIPFGHIGEEISLELARDQIAQAKEEADLVVLLLHWGFEYEYYPDPHFMLLARELIEMGADLIVGQGPHVLEPPEICTVNQGIIAATGNCSLETEDGAPRTAAVLYSLGNFGTDMPTLQAQVGMVATVSLDAQGVTGMGWEPVVSLRGPWVEPAEPLRDEDPDLAAELDRIEQHLGLGWRR